MSLHGNVVAGGSLTADATGSFAADAHSIMNYEWSLLDVTGALPVIDSPTQPQTTIHVPGQTAFTLRLSITDEVGMQSVKHMSLSTPAVVATAAPVVEASAMSRGTGGGGGGAMGIEWLIAAVALAMRRPYCKNRLFDSRVQASIERSAKLPWKSTQKKAAH